jgi:Sec-independent protein translocase protein TatA
MIRTIVILYVAFFVVGPNLIGPAREADAVRTVIGAVRQTQQAAQSAYTHQEQQP